MAAGADAGSPARESAYLDNAGTTRMPPEVVAAVVRWMNRGDPAAAHAAAREARRLLRRFRAHLAAAGGFALDGPQGYTVVFTSGGAEADCHVVTAAAGAYAARTGTLPHLITSAAEAPPLLACCLRLARARVAQLTVLPVRRCGADAAGAEPAGTVDPEELRRAIRPNTCLVSIAAAEGETGALNDLRALAAVARAARVPFHTDAARLYGQAELRPGDLGLAAFSVSFHRLHGPPGAGALVLRNDFLAGYGLGALVDGPQNGGLRGGLENVPALAGAFEACRRAAAGRDARAARVRALREGARAALAARFPAVHVDAYCAARPRVSDGDPATPRTARVAGPPRGRRAAARAARLDAAAAAGEPVLVWLGPADPARALPGALFFAVLGPEGKVFRAARALPALERRGVIVSAGAPPAAEGRPSAAVEALDVPPELWPGVLRVGFAGDSSAADAARLVDALADVLASGEALEDV